ncbi:hypothetical protein ACFOZ5_16925 [Marinobacter lacisalsi]|uniref:Uncharacterized protein n=1 Tax=Marinobacter lacisalsi TaxID=475979 RepID=A0ABV8QKI1_9GAMM
MEPIKHWLPALVASSALVLTGCGGSSGSSSSTPDDDTGDGGTEVTTIEGTAKAPAGSVAQLQPQSTLQIALNFLVPPAAAAITGLQPVDGADVELVRVDNNGDQIGDVLATDKTSITGVYTLEIPEGVSLAGNLVVRIQGSNAEMRSQVLEQDVDITPLSEYVLQRFIENGTELDTLNTDTVLTLRGKAEEFDIAATADLSSMLEKLDQEIGEFVDGQVDRITSDTADVTEIAGDWRGSALKFFLGDDDGDRSSGFFAAEAYGDNFTFSDQGNGVVTLTVDPRAEAEAQIRGQDGNAWLNYLPGLPETGDNESFSADYLAGGELYLETPFEENISSDGQSGSRFPPRVLRFQKALNTAAFFLVESDPLVRYLTDESGAVDPERKDGKEARYALETFVRLPESATAADMTGTFGRVYLGTYFENNVYEVENEHNEITFNGDSDSTIDIGTEQFMSLSRSFSSTTFSSDSSGAEAGVPFTLQADGSIDSIGGEPANVFVNEDFSIVLGGTFNGEDGSFAEISNTLMVRLPTDGAPDLAGRNYRVKFLAVEMYNTYGLNLARSRFDSTLSFGASATPSLDLNIERAEKYEGLTDLIEKSTETWTTSDLSVDIFSNGATSITINDDDGTGVTLAEGYLNHDGSIGIFRTSYDEDGDGSADPSELGLMVLVELP